MKTTNYNIGRLIIMLLIIMLSAPLTAQNENGYHTIEGSVKDSKSKKKLENVNISVPGTNIGTVTNEDGLFILKIPESVTASYIQFSHLGYTNHKLPITKTNLKDQTVLLSTNTNLLSEVIVLPTDPLKLVQQAIQKIDVNYSRNNNLLVGFYRETIKKRRNYITISEAVIDIFKTKYSEGAEDDRTSIFKGRKLISPKLSDTLVVKFQGGPNLSVFLDIVKNRGSLILNEEELELYKFTMDESVMIDDKINFVVKFEPKVQANIPLYYGKFYIEAQSLTISRAQFNLSMENEKLVTQYIVKKKPAKMHFKPQDVSFLVTYKQKDGISYLNYVQNEIKFKCDWKKRLFSTNYTIVSEMVVTSIKDNNVNKISYKESFKPSQVLSDKVSNFSDENFWIDYNIIEPSESLESAVNKLKKQYR